MAQLIVNGSKPHSLNNATKNVREAELKS
jgi:hypothetical protein